MNRQEMQRKETNRDLGTFLISFEFVHGEQFDSKEYIYTNAILDHKYHDNNGNDEIDLLVILDGKEEAEEFIKQNLNDDTYEIHKVNKDEIDNTLLTKYSI